MNKRQWYELVEKKIEQNIEKFYQDMYEADLVNVGSNLYRVEPCPSCGHNGCCTINLEHNYVNCFSGGCWFKGSHLHTFTKYVEHKGTPPKNTKQYALAVLSKWSGIDMPKYGTKQSISRLVKRQEIREIALEFYQRQLIESKATFVIENKFLGRQESLTPLEYQKEIRKHDIKTLTDFEIGFSANSAELNALLKSKGYTDEEIENAKIYMPQGLFIYPCRDPITKDILRINTKNAFGITRVDNKGNEVEIKGFSSSGDSKVCGFSPLFKFNRDIIIVEGENDGLTVYEEGFINTVVLGGSITETSEQLNILDSVEGIFYVATDDDDAGDAYYDCIQKRFPHKDVRRVDFNKYASRKYNDIDEYFKHEESPKSIFDLVSEAEFVETTEYKITKIQTKIWSIENRHKKIIFTIEKLNKNAQLSGRIDYFVAGVPNDVSIGATLAKCKDKLKPYSFYLSDEIESFFNSKINERTTDELLEIHSLSTHKSEIERILAERLFALEGEERDEFASKLKLKLGPDKADSIFVEMNNITNSKVLDDINSMYIPKMKLSQYFNVKNNDAYFYFTEEKRDGDAIRRLPFLLRNDGLAIRLDLLKRKDAQCLLLVDNKYEIQREVDVAVIDNTECSLTSKWATKFKKGDITPQDINPAILIKELVKYIEMFYYFKDSNIYKVIALYIMSTYYYELFGQIPYLFLNGEKGSGKSTLDNVLYKFCFNAKNIVDISEASLFRLCSFEGGTMILDEMENLTSRSKTMDSTMASVLKGGYSNSGGVYRQNMEKNTTESFNIYGPKVISNIFGIDDVIADRCIEIRTYRYDMSKGEHRHLEDPKIYGDLHMEEIKDLTSQCCISALKYFRVLHKIYTDKTTEVISTNSPRSAQILKPLLAVARFVDMFNAEKDSEWASVKYSTIKGPFEEALMAYHDTVVIKGKNEIESTTPEGILKSVVKGIARELADVNFPEEDKEYTIVENYKYKEPILYSLEEGWFEVNLAHFKCYLEQQLPGEATYTRLIAKTVKNCLLYRESRRVTVTLEDQDLIKEWTSAKPKIYSYKFNFADYIDDLDILNEALDNKNNDLF